MKTRQERCENTEKAKTVQCGKSSNTGRLQKYKTGVR